MSGQTVDEDLYLTFMASRRSSEKEITQFWEEQADFFTITMTPPTQHSAAIFFLLKQNFSASAATLQP